MGDIHSQLGNRKSDRDRTGAESKGLKRGASSLNFKRISRLVSEMRDFETVEKSEFAQIYPGNRPIPGWPKTANFDPSKRALPLEPGAPNFAGMCGPTIPLEIRRREVDIVIRWGVRGGGKWGTPIPYSETRSWIGIGPAANESCRT